MERDNVPGATKMMRIRFRPSTGRALPFTVASTKAKTKEQTKTKKRPTSRTTFHCFASRTCELTGASTDTSAQHPPPPKRCPASRASRAWRGRRRRLAVGPCHQGQGRSDARDSRHRHDRPWRPEVRESRSMAEHPGFLREHPRWPAEKAPGWAVACNGATNGWQNEETNNDRPVR